MAKPDNTRKIFLMRHGERIDFTFGSWIPYCFDEAGNYLRKDLNMPSCLPKRKDGPLGYLKDCPLTNIGVFQANMVGKALKEAGIQIDHVYCSPSFRSIQTCDGVLVGLECKENIKIKIEPGLFEWLTWYPEGAPEWLTPEELTAAGYNIDVDYVPFISQQQLRENKEACADFYARSFFTTKGAVAASTSGNVLFVGHAATLEVCSRGMIEEKPRSATDMTKVIQKVPYCSLLQLSLIDNKWRITEPPCPPITHSTNQRFDWKIFM